MCIRDRVLLFLKKYSPSDLKYEKRVMITSNKVTSYYKISDVHIEVDMGMLGCNSKGIWHDIFTQMNDILNAKIHKVGFMVCRNFHEIHNELLDIFYSYIQGSLKENPIKFIFITESVSFIPDNILGCCEVINIPRPSKSAYNNCIGKRIPSSLDLSQLDNIKNLKDTFEIIDMYDTICGKIVSDIQDPVIANWSQFRDHIYDIFTYNLDVHKCIWRILSSVVEKNHPENLSAILDKTYTFFRLFNNNYRPIYHLEGYFLFLKMQIIKMDT